MKKIKGKQIILLGLVALVITAGYYRWTVERDEIASISVAGDTLPANVSNENNSGDGVKDSEVKDFSSLRQERDTARSEASEKWEEIKKSSESSADEKNEAEEKLGKARENSENENTIETLVKAKGYAECFAHIDDNCVSVIVSGGEVNGAKVAQIKDIVIETTGTDIKNIKISEQ